MHSPLLLSSVACAILAFGAYFLGRHHGYEKAATDAIGDNLKRFSGTYPAIQENDLDYLRLFWLQILRTHIRAYEERAPDEPDDRMAEALQLSKEAAKSLEEYFNSIDANKVCNQVQQGVGGQPATPPRVEN